MKSNVVPISRARSVARRPPPRRRLKPAVRLKVAAAARPLPAVAPRPDTPIWLSIVALVAMTMWPSSLVWLVQLACRVAAWAHSA